MPDALRSPKITGNGERGSSTRIEGSRLSDAEVAELLGRLETRSFRNRDEEEVAGYAYVMELVFYRQA